MGLKELKSLVLEKRFVSDASKLKKHDLINLLTSEH